MEEKEDPGKHSWLSTVKFLLDYCNMNYMAESHKN